MHAWRCAACELVGGSPAQLKKRLHNGTILLAQRSTAESLHTLSRYGTFESATWQRCCKRKVLLQARKQGDEGEDAKVFLLLISYYLARHNTLLSAVCVGCRRVGCTSIC